jgi:hypothetical protein
MHSKTDVAVSLRLLRALDDIAASTPDPEFRQILVERGMRVVAGCAEKLGQEELSALHVRQAALESCTARGNGSGPIPAMRESPSRTRRDSLRSYYGKSRSRA